LAVTGYVLALGCGMTYYWGVRFNAPPVGVPAALLQPPLWFALVIAGLSAVGLTIAAIALLLLVILVEAIAPRTWRPVAQGLGYPPGQRTQEAAAIR
jgi:hypothetical protein